MQRQLDVSKIDVSKEFTCFLCNGYQTVQGSIRLEQDMVQLVTNHGILLEQFPYSNIASVGNEEPPTQHSLIFNLHTRPVYASHLLRKDKLVNLFSDLGLYRDDLRLPAEAMGFIGAESLSETNHPSSELFNDPPDIEGVLNALSTQLGQSEGEGYDIPSFPRKAKSKKGKKKKATDNWPNLSPSYYNDEQTAADTQQDSHGSTDKSQSTVTGQWSAQDLPKNEAAYRMAPTTARSTSTPALDTPDSQLLELQMLFPNHDEGELLRALIDCNYNTDRAVTTIFSMDSLANARSTTEVQLEAEIPLTEVAAHVQLDSSATNGN